MNNFIDRMSTDSPSCSQNTRNTDKIEMKSLLIHISVVYIKKIYFILFTKMYM